MPSTYNNDGKKKTNLHLFTNYTVEDAVRDGAFIHVGYADKEPVYFTSNLFADGYEDMQKRTELVKRGLEMLSRPDSEDTDYLWLRVVEKEKIWVARTGEGITYMRPEDY